MDKKAIISVSDEIIFNLKILAGEKEIVRRKLAVTAAKLAVTAEKLAPTAKKLAVTAAKLAATAKEKESVRRKLVVTAEEKESVRRRLVITAAKLAVTAEEKEVVRRKLVVTAEEKESVRRKLIQTAEKLKMSHKTLEKKVLERTKELADAKAKDEAILASIGDGLIVVDEKGKLIFTNKNASDSLGIGVDQDILDTKQEQYGVFDPVTFKMLPPNQIPLFRATKGQTLDKVPLFIRNSRIPDGKFISVTATPILLNGKSVGGVAILRDMTKEKEIDKAKTEFVSLASHQLRTPLSTVNWYAEMLLAGDVGELNKKQKKYLDEVYHSNQRMVELVNALLDVSNLELGTFVIEPESTDICQLARSVINEQKPQIDIKKIKFLFSCKKGISFIQADPKLLRMVIQNILSNSVKYTPEGGKIKVSISLATKKDIQIKISDTGYGIPKKQHEKIFTKLFRADNVRDKDTDGTGLGLYIVKSVVEKSGGKIWFESPEENFGTTFYVILPIKGVSKK